MEHPFWIFCWKFTMLCVDIKQDMNVPPCLLNQQLPGHMEIYSNSPIYSSFMQSVPQIHLILSYLLYRKYICLLCISTLIMKHILILTFTFLLPVRAHESIMHLDKLKLRVSYGYNRLYGSIHYMETEGKAITDYLDQPIHDMVNFIKN